MRRGALNGLYKQGKTLNDATSKTTTNQASKTAPVSPVATVPAGGDSHQTHANVEKFKMDGRAGSVTTVPEDNIKKAKEEYISRVREKSSGFGIITPLHNPYYGQSITAVIFLDQASRDTFAQQYDSTILYNFLVRKDPSGGGLIASHAVREGKALLVEAPLVCAPTLWIEDEKGSSTSFDDVVKRAVDALREDRQAAFHRLPNKHKTSDGSKKYTGIVNTNSLALYDALFGGKDLPYFGVFDDLSYLNYSEDPNVRLQWDAKACAMRLIACRDIERGEEVTIEYDQHAGVLAEKFAGK